MTHLSKGAVMSKQKMTVEQCDWLLKELKEIREENLKQPSIVAMYDKDIAEWEGIRSAILFGQIGK